MKKRKFPAGPVIAFVVLLGGAGAYSLVNTKAANLTPEQAAQQMAEEQMRQQQADAPAPDANAAPAIPDKDSVRNSVKPAAKTEGGPRGLGAPGAPGTEAAPGSSILAPKQQPYKPVPNESATSSQWFEKK